MAGGLTSSQDSGRFKFYLHIAGASQGQSVFSSWLELSENKNKILSPTPAGSRTLAERVVRSSQAGMGHSRRQHRGQSSLLGGSPAGRCPPWRAGGPVSPTSPPAPVRAHWYFVISEKNTILALVRNADWLPRGTFKSAFNLDDDSFVSSCIYFIRGTGTCHISILLFLSLL